jgi:hypothetical protein
MNAYARRNPSGMVSKFHKLARAHPRGSMALEGPLTEAEKKKLRSILSDPKALDAVIDKALEGWGGRRAWKKKTKSS